MKYSSTNKWSLLVVGVSYALLSLSSCSDKAYEQNNNKRRTSSMVVHSANPSKDPYVVESAEDAKKDYHVQVNKLRLQHKTDIGQLKKHYEQKTVALEKKVDSLDAVCSTLKGQRDHYGFYQTVL